MRKELLNQRPTSALRGQSPLCESVGAGHTSTHPSIFTKALLVLLTMLLLPSTVWGQEPEPTIKTYFSGFDNGVTYASGTTGTWSLYTDSENTFPGTSDDPEGISISNTNYIPYFDFTSDFQLYGTLKKGQKIARVEFEGDFNSLSLKKVGSKGATGGEVIALQSGSNSKDLILTEDIDFSSGQYIDIYFVPNNTQSVVIESIKIYNLQTAPITVSGNSPDADGKISGEGITGTVTFDAQNSTLTLENATIIPEGEGRGISYTGTDNLTISLKGSNTVKGVGGCNAILYDGTGAATPTLTFTNGGTEPCSLQLESVNEPTIAGFSSVVNTGLYKIDETILGADQSNTYKTTITSLGGGSGTSSDPIIIKTAADLRDFAKLVNRGTITDEYIKLNPKGGELDCDGLTGFEPIGFYGNPFIGKFDGNNCTIKNLTYSTGLTPERVGLFGYVGNEDVSDAKIEKLTLSNCSFHGGEYVGGIVGELKNGTIENCVLSSCTVKSGNAQIPYTGGIAGWVDNGTINTCTFNSGLVDCTTAYSGEPSGGVYAGGIVGYIYSTNSVTVSLCTVSSTNVKSVHSGSDGAYDIYVGGIVGCSLGTVAISDNKVTNTYNTDNPKKISCQSSVDYTVYHCGAIIGEKGDATTLSNNIYEYDVITEIAGTPKSGYTQRGIGGTTYNEQTEKYEENPDVTEDNGAVMYTKALTVGVSNECEDYYEPLTDYEDGILAFAPGQTVDIEVFPADGVTISSASLVYTPTGGTEQTVPLENKSETAGEYNYVFEMPDADATLNATIVQTYDLWIGETQVTSTNAANVLGDGKVSFTESVGVDTAPTYTLTLNGATLTVPVKVGLANLTIDIQGTNTITTNTTCIQNTAATGVPSLTFKSSGDVVGSLTLTDTDEEGTNGVISDSFFEHFTISKELALVMLRYGNYTSDTYYFTAGEVHYAQLLPSYGVQVNDMQVYAGNAEDVLGDGKVSFDEETATLTLNNASGISTIRTSLSTLNIDLVGSNSLYRESNGSILESASGEAVTINLKSTGATGSLTIETPANYGATLKGDNVTLKPVDPIVLLSSDVTENRGTLVYGVSYDLTVSGVSVTSANASAIQTGAEFITVEDGGSVTFDTATSTLTLNNAHLKHGIVSGLDNLKIRFQGTNKINSDSQVDNMDTQEAAQSNAISSSLATATLTFEKTGDGTIDLFAKTFLYDPVISGFASVNYGSGDYQCYVQSSVPSYYDGTGKRLVNFYDVKGVTNATITSVASYPLWIGSGNFIQVTSANSEGITGTAIESGNVSFVPSDNKLKLKNAAITAKILSGLTNLTIDVEGNCSVIIPDSGSVVRSVVAGALTITKTGTNASLRLKNIVQDTYYPVIQRFSSLTYTDFNLDTETSATYGQFGLGMNGDNAQIFDMYGLYNPDETESYKKGITSATFTTATLYPLWVGGVHVTSDIASAITGTYIQKKTDDSSVSYDAGSNTLTLDNVILSTTASAPIIVSSLDALKVNIVGSVEFEFQDVTPSYVFGSTNPNGVLTFTTTDDGKPQIYIDNGSNNGAFTGFKTVNYEKGLALRTQQIDYTDYWIEPMVAPAFGAFSLNAETGKLTGTITSYAYEGATIKYSIDYADDHENVSNAVYSTSVVMEGPGTVTAYIAVGESTSPVTTAKWFAFASHEVQGVKGQESVAVPAVIPTIETSDDITVTYSSENATIASVSEGNIAFNGVGATTISGLYEIGDEVPFIILNDGDIFDEIAVTVVPPAPVIAYDGTKTYLSTDKIEISLDPTYAAAPSGSNTIYYSWDENPTTGTEYPEGGVEAQNGTLTAWVVATVSDVNYESAKATQEFTAKTDISGYTVSGLAESETYTGSAIVPEFTVKATATATTSLTANTDYTVSYKKVGESEALTDVTSMVDAGSYKIIITGAGNYGGSISKDFEIKKASVDWENTGWTSPEAKADLVFTNEAKDLITGATVPDGVTVKYCYKHSTSEFDEQTRSELPDPANWTTTIPQGTNIGYYAVFYKVEGGNNYEDWGPNEVGIVINIGKGEANITADNQTTTYTGSPIEYEKDNITLSLETISKDGIGISYIGPDPNDPGKTITLDGAPTAAGTYTVEITLADEHYNAETVNATLTIEQFDISQAVITLDNTVLTYNGEQQTVNVTKVMAGDIEVPVDCYEVSGNTEKEAGDYKLTVTAKTKDSQGNAIKNNFTGSAEKDWKIKNRTVTAKELGLSEDQPQATYYSDTENLEVPDGVVANIITSVSDGMATTQRISYIPKDVPVFVELTTSSEESLTEIPKDPSQLPLKGTAEPKDVTSISGGTVFVLYKGEFVKSISGTIPAHRCYLLLSNDVAAGTRAFGIIRGIGGSNGSTAIKSIEIDNTPSTIENWYDMRGRRIEKPTKTGIYIKNGKIVVINNK